MSQAFQYSKMEMSVTGMLRKKNLHGSFCSANLYHSE